VHFLVAHFLEVVPAEPMSDVCPFDVIFAKVFVGIINLVMCTLSRKTSCDLHCRKMLF